MVKRRLVKVLAVAVVGIGLAVVAGGMLLGPPGGPKNGPPGESKSNPESAANPVRETDPVAVTTEAVVARPVQRTVSMVGSLFGREEADVSAKVEGLVRRIHHDVGDEVSPGDSLLDLDQTDAELSVAEAQKGLELELAKLGLKEPPPDKFDVTTLPTVARAAAKDRHATAKYQRVNQTRSSTAVTADEFQQTEYEYQDAKEAHRQARLDAETTLAAVRQRQATLNTARQRLKDLHFLVPAPGTQTSSGPVTYVVAQRNVSEGEMVRPGSGALYRLVIADTLKLRAAVPERHHGEVQVGQSVEIRVEAFPKDVFPGTVSRVNPTVNRTSRTFQVEVAVPNPNRKLAPGSFAKAEVRTKLDQDAVLVPEEALVQFAGVTKVYIVRNGKATAVVVQPSEVRIASNSKLLAEVRGAVRPGERVVTSGQTKLTDGRAVKIRSEHAKGDIQ